MNLDRLHLRVWPTGITVITDIDRVIEFFFHINMSFFVYAGIIWNFGVFLLLLFELVPK